MKASILPIRSPRQHISHMGCIVSLLLAAAGHANMLPEDFHGIDAPGVPFPDALTEQGSLHNPGGFLYSPICTDAHLLSPPLIADLQAEVDGYQGARNISRGGDPYWLVERRDVYFQETSHLSVTVTPPAFYGELSFHSPGKPNFTLRVVSAFTNGHAGRASTCLARTQLASNGVFS